MDSLSLSLSLSLLILTISGCDATGPFKAPLSPTAARSPQRRSRFLILSRLPAFLHSMSCDFCQPLGFEQGPPRLP
jgi:hypothetical protein